MEAIFNLRAIIGKLYSEEKVSIRAYLKLFQEKGKADTNRGLTLFEYLVTLENRKKDIHEIELAIYKKSNKPALKKLANRTKEKVLEALILDVNVDRAGVYSNRTLANIEVRKKLTQAQILNGRGLRQLASTMFEKIVDQCMKFELYDELLTALRILITTRTLEEGRKQLPEMLEQFQKYDYAKNAVMYAEINHRKVVSGNAFHSDKNINQKELRDILDGMYEDYVKTDSSQIGFYYYHLEAQNYQQSRDYLKARKELLNGYRLIQKYDAINIPNNEIGVLINLADNDLYLSKFDRTFDKAEEASQLCKSGSFNYEQCIELMFYAKYYKGEHQIASNILFQLLPSEDQTTNFRTGRRSYFLASTYFMQEDYRTALRWVSLINPIEADKEGWNLGIKVLQIMTAIELNEFDDATAKIDALRKYFENGNGGTNHRAQMINNIFLSLSYNGYNFKAIYQEQRSLIDMLGERVGELEWMIKSSEMVIFHQWFVAKATRQVFTQKVISYQLEYEDQEITNQEMADKKDRNTTDDDPIKQ
ncbi:MAG: hypothetical protein ABIQ40_01225 [Bacteroidia bacterium]